MKLKFWVKTPVQQKTTLQVVKQTLTHSQMYFVESDTPETALMLIRQLQTEKKE